MSKFSLKGLGIALVTPFNNDYSIDFEALGKLIDFHISAGIDYFVVLGTTGEAATLTPDERKQVRDFAVERVAARVPLVLGLGGNCTQGVIEEIKHTDLSPFSAILSVVPFYNKPSQQGIYEHYMAIADASPVPVILYNVPGRTGVNLGAVTTLKLARAHENILGIKEASGNLNQVEEILANKPENFQLVSGDDSLAMAMIRMGADGVISVIGNAYPRTYGRLVSSALAGDFTDARKVQTKLERMFEYLFADGNPAGIKYLLAAKFLIHNKLRLPLTPITSALADKIYRAMYLLPDD